ncbi:MAG TPA: amino acid adenylation domain-containing protein, partial [Thermoanaerobaculia bacterium]|nr:amino acid adenylation domain-containing protein [Thermoanaerobaculia bacterium]
TPEQVDATHFQFALQTPQVWLDHQASELAGRLVLSWQVVDGLFPPGLVEAMFEAYCGLVARLGAEEDLWTSPMAVPPPAAHLALAAEANATAAPIAPRPLHAAFTGQARRTPDSPAVVTAGRTVSYGELARCAARLARRLRELGAGPDRLVAVAMEKGWEQAAVVLAVLEAGAAYLPLDPGLPRERRRHLLEAGQVEIVLTQPWLAGGLDGPRALQVIPVTPADLTAPGDGLAAEAPTDSLAYVIFTSGSTGLPKGVAIEHANAWNTVADVNGRFGIGPADRVLALSALSFDLSVWDLFGPMSAGGAVVMPDAAVLREPARWVELMQAEAVTVWNSVPALMEMLVDHLEGRGEPLPATLRLVLLSGDWIPVSLPDRIRRLAPGIQVVSLGGATEASIWSILHPIQAVDPAWSSIPYGRPMANQTFQVLDENLRPRPVWVPGQLYIGGAGLARGYWRDEERTRAAFLIHPETGERLYRTGDLGRRLPDGTLEFLGREDLQVKVQGYRIELGEIEAALLAHPGVRGAVAAAVGPRRGAKRLVAYVVPVADGLDLEELRGFLAAKLPSYMVPAALALLDELPLTANGKVDRQALPDPERTRPHREAVPPRDELEETLARIWSDVLGDTLAGAPVSVHDDFFELGGHSLLAVRLMGRIQAELGRELPLSALFGAPTVEALAGLLRQEPETPASGRRALVEVRPGGAGLPFFCVHPVGGNVLCYRDLARELGTGQPFFALQTPDPAPSTVEEMAAAYLAEVRQVQPRGPYRLGGWSMGGVVAYEMARQLECAGEEVELLAMIDPWTPEPGDAGGVDGAVLASWFLGDLGGLTGVKLSIDPEELRPLDPGARAALLLERAREAHVLPPGFGLAELSRHLETFQHNFRALLDYAPGEYPGRPLLLLAADGGAAGTAVEVWSGLAPDAEARLLPGDHYTLVRPPRVTALAEAIATALAAAMAREMAGEMAPR